MYSCTAWARLKSSIRPEKRPRVKEQSALSCTRRNPRLLLGADPLSLDIVVLRASLMMEPDISGELYHPAPRLDTDRLHAFSIAQNTDTDG
jgi:hypothetical protein